jgi:hypothetical protein
MGISVPLLYMHTGIMSLYVVPSTFAVGVLCLLAYNFICFDFIAEWVVPVGHGPRVPARTARSVGNVIEHRGWRHVRGRPFCHGSTQGSWVVSCCWPGSDWGPTDKSWVSLLYKYHIQLWSTACIRRYSSSGVWCRVAGRIFPDVQEGCSHWVTYAWHYEVTGLFWNVRYHVLEELRQEKGSFCWCVLYLVF